MSHAIFLTTFSSFRKVIEFVESTIKYQLPLKADLLRSCPLSENASFVSSLSCDNNSSEKCASSKSKASLNSSLSTFYSSLEGPITHAISSLSLSSFSHKIPVESKNHLHSSGAFASWSNNMRSQGLHHELEKEEKKNPFYSPGTMLAGTLLASLGLHERDLQLLRSTPTLQSPSRGKFKATNACNHFHCESVL